MSTDVYVAAGSNVEPRRHLARALAALEQRFGEVRTSPVYRNPPVGFDGDDFLNLVLHFDTTAAPHAVLAELHAIERAAGRDRAEPRYGPRALDLDLLLYGDLVDPELGLPRRDLVHAAFVLGPMAALAGTRAHPGDGRSFAELWAAFDQTAHPMMEVACPELERPAREPHRGVRGSN